MDEPSRSDAARGGQRPSRFRAVDLAAIRGDTRGPAPGAASAELHVLLRSLPAGEQRLWGVPFSFAVASRPDRWSWLGDPAVTTTLPVNGRADHVLFAHFCLPPGEPGQAGPADPSALDAARVGERLAEYVVVHEDGTEQRQVIRRRFEVNDLVVAWGQLAFVARPHREAVRLDWRGPHAPRQWGTNQLSCDGPAYTAWTDEPGQSVAGAGQLLALCPPRRPSGATPRRPPAARPGRAHRDRRRLPLRGPRSSAPAPGPGDVSRRPARLARRCSAARGCRSRSPRVRPAAIPVCRRRLARWRRRELAAPA